MSVTSLPPAEAVESFECFGGSCTVLVQGSGPAGRPAEAVERVKRRMLEWHSQFSRFEPSSELSLLNQDPRERVPVSAIMARFVAAAVCAAELTGGLVDPTLVSEVEKAGYTGDFAAAHAGAPVPGGVQASAQAGRTHARPTPAAPHPDARWRRITVDRDNAVVIRPPGLRLDSGGVAKGLFGDVLASALSRHDSFAVVAAGDVRFGGAGDVIRPVHITSPLASGEVLHTFELGRGAVATSGTTKRSWVDQRGSLAHHLIDPATGTPAFTGVVQATALAPTGVEAEALAKAALLAGAGRAAGWLYHGGVVVYDDGTHEVVEPEACA